MFKILLVESKRKQLPLARALLSDKDCLVSKAKSLIEARSLNLVSFDVIIIEEDNFLKDAKGFIRQIRHKTNAVIIVMLDSICCNNFTDYFNYGADDVFSSKLGINFIAEKMKAIKRRQYYLKNNYFLLGNVRFDLETNTITLNDEVIDVNVTEFKILYYLARNNERIVKKEELYEFVWGTDNEINKAALWSAISRLNKKIISYSNDFEVESNHDGYHFYIRK